MPDGHMTSDEQRARELVEYAIENGPGRADTVIAAALRDARREGEITGARWVMERNNFHPREIEETVAELWPKEKP